MRDASTPQVAYEFAGFRLEPARRALFCPDGSPAHLSGKPFDTLLYLIERAGEPVARGERDHSFADEATKSRLMADLERSFSRFERAISQRAR